ncbi:hypothetical protein [Dactylosporangium sp. CA-233914]|uniref:hypothetical protein n=1 Tax=Dactylosporangium sp. CA-233914 TaxID=3239934 RepID=UPI003D8AAD38
MTSEPPPGYVAFVTRHLEPLRRDASQVAGAEDADVLYADVLTDVATHWSWLELRRTRLGRPEAAEDFLGRVFQRRSERWFGSGEESGEEEDRQITVTPEERPEKPQRRVYVSTAVRLAPMVVPRKARPRNFVAGPVSEAAIAWWHAYENIRRRRLVYAGFVVLALLLALAQFSAPAPEM